MQIPDANELIRLADEKMYAEKNARKANLKRRKLEMKERYGFRWKDLGDIEDGRPNLGDMTYVAVYRLLQYTMRDILEGEYGNARARELFAKAGMLAGREFCRNVLDKSLSFNAFVS